MQSTIKMRNKKSRRIAPSSAYIGSGNKTSVFSRKARKPFQDMAEIYKNEAIKIKGNHEKKLFEKLSEEDKKLIRERIIRNKIKEKWRFLVILIISSFMTILIVTAIVILLKIYF